MLGLDVVFNVESLPAEVDPEQIGSFAGIFCRRPLYDMKIDMVFCRYCVQRGDDHLECCLNVFSMIVGRR